MWLFGAARGRDRVAALAFRAAFALALLGLLAGAARAGPALVPLALTGHLLAVSGALLAVAAQGAMTASWRVGGRDGADAFVTGGLFDLSRNPTFVGQGALLAGVALALPSVRPI